MSINEVYIKFLQKVNKNLNSNNVVADKPRFVLLYHEAQIRRIQELIQQGNDERVREIQEFLKPNESLPFIEKQSDRVLYKLPTDYLDLSSVYATATKEKCEGKIYLHEIKDKNYTTHLSDNYNQPSFEYREAPYIVADNAVNIFTNDFEIKKVVLSYYRYPREIDISGYINLNNTPSQDIYPEGDDKFVNKVISMAAADFARNNYDGDGIQINKERVINNI